jgi:uncharacterized FAD-dependent dehydrogenase
MKHNKYDVIIIGCGTSGIFAGYELTAKQPDLKILMIEQGNEINRRKCPMIEKKGTDCAKCVPCSIMRGFGGAGAFSDGKYNFTTEFGGWLNDYIPDNKVMELIHYVDRINVEFGATTEVFSTYSEEAKKIEKRALENDLHLLQAQVKHLGTENNLNILKKLYEHLLTQLEILCNTQVKNIIPQDTGFKLELENDRSVECDYLIAAPGRSGAEWFSMIKPVRRTLY